MSPYGHDFDPAFAVELPPCAIQVLFDGLVVSEELLRYYFEDSKRSGGGDIRDICFDKSTKCAYVVFQDPKGKQQLEP